MGFWGLLLCIYLFFLLLTFFINQYEVLNKKKSGSIDPFIFVSLLWEGVTTIFVAVLDFLGFFINYDFLFSEGSKKYPIIFVPGYSANRGYFFPYAYFLNKAGYKVFTLPPVPFYCNIYYLAEILGNKVEYVLKETSAEKVILIGHSMGGLISRYYVQRLNGVQKVSMVLTISTPHRGTKIAVFGSGYSAKEMIPESRFIKEINLDINKFFNKVRLVSLGSSADNLVVPYTNSFARVGKKYHLDFLGHNSMMFSQKVFSIILRELETIKG